MLFKQWDCCPDGCGSDFYSFKEGIVLYFNRKLCHYDHDNIGYLNKSGQKVYPQGPDVAPTARGFQPKDAGFPVQRALYYLAHLVSSMDSFKSIYSSPLCDNAQPSGTATSRVFFAKNGSV